MMAKNLVKSLVVAAIIVFAIGLAQADTITIQSDATTLAQQVGSSAGAPSSSDAATIDSGNYSITPWVSVVVGSYGTFTPLPTGAPAATQVVQIAMPADDGNGGYLGYSGFFLSSFTLPVGFSNASLTGSGNVDDIGYAFLNGGLISTTSLSEFGNATFNANSGFVAGTNWLVISDDNSGGGPSGAAYYATVTYNTTSVPEPASLLLVGIGLGGLALSRRRMKEA